MGPFGAAHTYKAYIWEYPPPPLPPVKTGTVTDGGDGLYVTGLLQETAVNFLVDTGANITIVKPEIYEKIPESVRPELEAVDTKMVLADGSAVPYVGRTPFSTCGRRQGSAPHLGG